MPGPRGRLPDGLAQWTAWWKGQTDAPDGPPDGRTQQATCWTCSMDNLKDAFAGCTWGTAWWTGKTNATDGPPDGSTQQMQPTDHLMDCLTDGPNRPSDGRAQWTAWWMCLTDCLMDGPNALNFTKTSACLNIGCKNVPNKLCDGEVVQLLSGPWWPI